MNLAKDAKEIIHTLEENRFYAECPCCGDAILLKDAGLFYLDDWSMCYASTPFALRHMVHVNIQGLLKFSVFGICSATQGEGDICFLHQGGSPWAQLPQATCPPKPR